MLVSQLEIIKGKAAYIHECDYIVFLNNDLIFEDPNILQRLVFEAETKKLDMVGPTILNYPEKKIWYCAVISMNIKR